MKSICVTGGRGFIGRKLCAALAARKLPVTVVDRRADAGPWDRLWPVDITGPLGPECLTGVDTVFHLAGKAHALAEVRQDEADYFRINTEGTRHVLEAARQAGVRRFVFFSTVKAMSRDDRPAARAGEGPALRAWTEADVIEPDTPYGRSKLEAEKLVLHGGFVPEPVVLRLCAVYGPGAKGNLQKMLAAVDRGRFPPLPDTGSRRSMVHVSDVVGAALLAAEKPEAVGGTFIVADGVAPTVRQIHRSMCRALGRPEPRWAVPAWVLRGLGRTGDFIGRVRGRRFVFDSDMLEKLTGPAWFSPQQLESRLGFRPEWNLEKALPEMVQALRTGAAAREGPVA